MRHYTQLYFTALTLLLLSCCGNGDESLRPTLATLKHPADKKFIGQEGVKELLETYMKARFLLKPEIKIEALRNRSKSDLKNPTIYEDNEKKYAPQVQNGYLADVYVKFISDEIGYGVFAHAPLKKGDLVGEYAGIIQKLSDTKDSTWAWSYPSNIYKDELSIPPINVDGKYAGNALRFVNHSDKPNTEMRHIFLEGFVRTLYVCTRDIAMDEQLSVSYGPNYWSGGRRHKRDI